ncbi:hypothetical protein CsSME_00014207 [Camellia sinensis var. sinensis]
MSAIVCGKRTFFEDIPSLPQSSSSPLVSKRLRCSSSTSPVHFSSFSNSPSLLDQLRARFPDMDNQEPLHDIVGFRKETDGIRIDVALQWCSDAYSDTMYIQVIGLNNVSTAGDEFEVVSSLDVAREKPKTRTVSL